MGEFRMPSLGADMDEGTLLEWLVAPGDRVRRGDIVAVVDTEKSDIEVEVFDDGVVGELLVEVGATVPVGTPLARIDPPSDGAESSPVPVPASEPASPPGGPPRGVPTTERTAGRVLSPVVRHLAEDLQVELRSLTGTGTGGVITRHDVEAAAAALPSATASSTALAERPPPVRPGHALVRSSPYARRLARERGVELRPPGSGPDGAVLAVDVPEAPTQPPADRAGGMREAIARAMARSKREIPHYYLQTTVDLGVALEWLEQRNAGRPVTERVLPAVLLLKATAVAAREHPGVNGWWDDGHRPASDVHLGVAIALRDGGLVAPGIADADQMSLGDLMAALRDLTRRARAGRVRQREWTGQTITVTSLGDRGVEAVWGVIHPPQLAMVGFGGVHDDVVAVDGTAVVRPVVVTSLAADHRASDGMDGAAFLVRIAELLQEPEALDRPVRHETGGSTR